MRSNDLRGQQFGRWTVLGRSNNIGKKIAWLCKCECGNENPVRADHLKGGNSKSCGCLRTETHTTHGHSSATEVSPEYSSWHNMLTRCTNKNHGSYDEYNGRGITVCERWLTFEKFLEDMGKKPTSQHSIERVNNDKGYYPDNCIWADRSTQQRNQRIRKDNVTGIRGVYYNKEKNKHTAIIYDGDKRTHIGHFDTIKEAEQARKQAELKYWGKSSL